MEEDFEGVSKVFEVLVLLRKVEGRQGFVGNEIVAQYFGEEQRRLNIPSQQENIK